MPVDQRKRVFAWVMWDPGTQPFASVITTFVFAVYLVGDSFGPKDRTVTALSWAMSLAGLAIALLAPVMGQWAGRRERKVTALKWLTWVLAVMSGLLFFVKPHPSYLVLGLVLLGIGTVISDVGSSLYNGMLDDVAEPDRVGRISGLGWGMGYLGGIIALLVIYIAWIKPQAGWFGATSHESMNIRVAMLFCAAWILVLTLPTFLILRDNHGQSTSQSLSSEGSEHWDMPTPNCGAVWCGSGMSTVTLLFSSSLLHSFATGSTASSNSVGHSLGRPLDSVRQMCLSSVLSPTLSLAFLQCCWDALTTALARNDSSSFR